MNQTAPKSATTAGLLGIFLGWTGAHWWYLGNKKKGILHLALLGGAILLWAIGLILSVTALSSFRAALTFGWVLMLFNGLAGLVLSGNSIWGLVEGIIILTKGDAGLAAQGIPVAGTPVAPSAAQPAAPGTAAPGAMPATPGTTAPADADAAASSNPALSAADSTAAATSGPTSSADASASSDAAAASAVPASATAPDSVAAQHPPKAPMNPATKKKIIVGSCVGAGAIVLIVVAIIVISAILRVNYAQAYKYATMLNTEVNDIYNDRSCERVVSYVDSSYLSERDYNEYITACLNTGTDLSDLINQLGDTDGVKRNSEIQAQFDAFKQAYNAATITDSDREAAAKYYQVWHQYILAKDNLSGENSAWDLTDSEVTAVANVLINSEIESFVTYGRGWLEHTLAGVAAYHAWHNASYSDSNKNDLYKAYQAASSAQKTWVSDNKPAVADFPAIASTDFSKVKTESNKLARLVAETFEENYDYDSGYCYEFFGEVVCEY